MILLYLRSHNGFRKNAFISIRSEYRTVLTKSSCVVSRSPIDLQLNRDREFYDIKKTVRTLRRLVAKSVEPGRTRLLNERIKQDAFGSFEAIEIGKVDKKVHITLVFFNRMIKRR